SAYRTLAPRALRAASAAGLRVVNVSCDGGSFCSNASVTILPNAPEAPVMTMLTTVSRRATFRDDPGNARCWLRRASLPQWQRTQRARHRLGRPIPAAPPPVLQATPA